MEIENNQIVRSKEEYILNCLTLGVALRLLANMLNTDIDAVNKMVIDEAQEQLELTKRKPGMIDHMINEQLNLRKNSPDKFVIQFDYEL